jgi:hypothetical protein
MCEHYMDRFTIQREHMVMCISMVSNRRGISGFAFVSLQLLGVLLLERGLPISYGSNFVRS